VFGKLAGLTLPQIAIFVSAIYVGALVLQYPIGYISDRMDRRVLICGVSALGGLAAVLGFIMSSNFQALLVAGFIIGGTSNPLYSLLIAYTNDFLEHDDMAAASGGLIFINGLGAIVGPIVTGWLMGAVGPAGFFAYIGFLMVGLAVYAAYRMTQRAASTSVEDMTSYSPISPAGSPIVVEVAQEVYIETALEDEALAEEENQMETGRAP
jgi:MFS family permease